MVHICLTFYFDSTSTTGYFNNIFFTPTLPITDGRDRKMYSEENLWNRAANKQRPRWHLVC